MPITSAVQQFLDQYLQHPFRARSMPNNPDIGECVEWDHGTRTMRYHFIDRAECPPGSYKTLCGEVWKDYEALPNKQGATGFHWHERWDRVLHFQYKVIYCNGCGVDEAGYFHDAATQGVRLRQRQANMEQRERIESEEPRPEFTCNEGCGRTVGSEDTTCDRCVRDNCRECDDLHHPDDLEDGLCSSCREADDDDYDEVDEPEDSEP